MSNITLVDVFCIKRQNTIYNSLNGLWLVLIWKWKSHRDISCDPLPSPVPSNQGVPLWVQIQNKLCNVIVGCAVLHNKAIRSN